MAIDPSIPLQIGQGVSAPPNMLDTFGKYQGISNAMATNDAIKANIAQTKQTTAQSGGNYIAQKMAQFLALPENMRTQATARQLIDHTLAEGGISPEVAQVWHDKVNQTKSARDLDTLAIRGVFSNLNAPDAFKNVFGENGMVNTGGETVPGTITSPLQRSLNPQLPGFVQTGGNLGGTLSASEQNATGHLPVMDANGNPTGATRVVTGAQIAREAGQGNLLPNGAFGAGNGRIVPPVPAQPAPTVQSTAPQPVQAAPMVKQQSGLGTTMTPGDAAAAPATGAASVNMATELHRSADNVPTQKAILGEMESNLAKFTTGKGQQASLNAQAYIQSFAPQLASALGIAPDKIASADTFNKLAQAIASQQALALGAGTDQSRMTVMGANPNMDLSKMGNVQIIHMLQGNADAIEAKRQAWLDYANRKGPGNYQQFSAEFNKNFDPRVYQMRYFDNAERKRMLDGMSEADKAQFFTKLRASQGGQ